MNVKINGYNPVNTAFLDGAKAKYKQFDIDPRYVDDEGNWSYGLVVPFPEKTVLWNGLGVPAIWHYNYYSN